METLVAGLKTFGANSCIDTVFWGQVCDSCNGSAMLKIMSFVVEFLGYGIGIVGVIAIMVVGIQYLTASGSAEKAIKARTRFVNMAIGLAIYVAIFGIFNFLMPMGKLGMSVLVASEEVCPEKTATQIEVKYPIDERLYARGTVPLAGACNFNDVSAQGCILYCQDGGESWTDMQYGTGSECSSYADAACGPTSMAMVIANLTGNGSITPTVIGDKAVSMGARICGDGTVGPKLITVVSEYGLKYEKIGFDEASINNALSQGKVVWLSANGSSPFTKIGHFIAIRGRTSSGNWLLFNSAGGCNKGVYASSKKEYSPSSILNATSKANSGPYAIGR